MAASSEPAASAEEQMLQQVLRQVDSTKEAVRQQAHSIVGAVDALEAALTAILPHLVPRAGGGGGEVGAVPEPSEAAVPEGEASIAKTPDDVPLAEGGAEPPSEGEPEEAEPLQALTCARGRADCEGPAAGAVAASGLAAGTEPAEAVVASALAAGTEPAEEADRCGSIARAERDWRCLQKKIAPIRATLRYHEGQEDEQLRSMLTGMESAEATMQRAINQVKAADVSMQEHLRRCRSYFRAVRKRGERRPKKRASRAKKRLAPAKRTVHERCAANGRRWAGECRSLRERRLAAEREAKKCLEAAAAEGRRLRDEEVEGALREWGFARNRGRVNVMREGQTHVMSDTLGLIRDYCGKIHITHATQMYPAVSRLLVQWLRERLPPEAAEFGFTSISLNHNYAARLHRDRNNLGPSLVRSLGDFTGGELSYWPEDDRTLRLESLPQDTSVKFQPRDGMLMFDGNCAHSVDDFVGKRFSVVFFTLSGYAKCKPQDRAKLEELGFALPVLDGGPEGEGAATRARPPPCVRFWTRSELDRLPLVPLALAPLPEPTEHRARRRSRARPAPLRTSAPSLEPPKPAELLGGGEGRREEAEVATPVKKGAEVSKSASRRFRARRPAKAGAVGGAGLVKSLEKLRAAAQVAEQHAKGKQLVTTPSRKVDESVELSAGREQGKRPAHAAAEGPSPEKHARPSGGQEVLRAGMDDDVRTSASCRDGGGSPPGTLLKRLRDRGIHVQPDVDKGFERLQKRTLLGFPRADGSWAW